MKKYFSRQVGLNIFASFIGLVFISAAFYSQVRYQAEAATPRAVEFSGTIIGGAFCCNGWMFKNAPFPTSPNKYIYYIQLWPDQKPNPPEGKGLYQFWNYKIGNRNLGSSIPGGVCLNPAEKCKPLTGIKPSVVPRMGVTLR